MSTTAIVGVINELESIRKELKALREQSRRLNGRKAQLEGEILAFMEAKEQSGLKYKGLKIEAEEKEVFARLKKADKEQSAISTLRQHGVADAERAYHALVESMRGEAKHKYKVKIVADRARKY